MTAPDPRKLCFKCRNRYTNDIDWNKIRAMVLTKDQIAGHKMIQISEEVHRSIHELSLSMKQTNTSFNDIIKLCVEAYKRDRPITDQLENIGSVSDNEEE